MPLLRRLPAAVLASLALLACDDDDPVDPTLATHYALSQVNGAALPAPQGPGPDDETVLAGSLHFQADGRVARSITLRSLSGDVTTYPDTLRYGRTGTRVWMLRPIAPTDTVWGRLGARSFEFTAGTITTYRYQVAN